MIEKMKVFYYVASLNSFSKTAVKLNLSKGYISKLIGELEHELQIKLLNRTTRHLSLTDAGKIFYYSCEKIMHEEMYAKTLIASMRTEPSGELKISAPHSLISTTFSTIIPAFCKKYPNINLQIDASSSIKDLFKNEIDIAIRITKTPSPNYVAALIANFNFILCTTKKYLKNNPQIKKPSDLKEHQCLIYLADPRGAFWSFGNKNDIEEIKVSGYLKTNNEILLLNALKSGLGVAYLPSYLVQNEINKGELIQLLAPMNTENMPIYAIYPSLGSSTPKTHCFISFLKKHFKAN